MQLVMNKCFLLNPEKNLAQIRLVDFEKNAHFNSEKCRGFRNHGFRKPETVLSETEPVSETMVSECLKLSFNLLTAF